MDTRKKIAVLFGGCSPEYGVSLQSAHGVLETLDREQFEPVPVGIDRGGDWFLYTGDLWKIPEDVWRDPGDCVPAALSPRRSDHGLLVFQKGGVERIRLDAVFPVLHGRNGEDGTVQGLCELAGIPLIGCGTLASALCMNKSLAHRLAKEGGVPVPEGFTLRKGETLANVPERAAALGYPLFVKPLRAGSSYGVTRVTEPEGLSAALELAFSFDSAVIVEEAIDGVEVGCAVLGNDELTVGEVDEIELSQGFFDFTEKYTLKTSAIHVPARLMPETTWKVKELAKKVYRLLGCQGFARVDLFLERSGRVVFSEVNTIPGFTAHSRYPAMMRAAGWEFSDVLTKLVELAVAS